MLQVLFFGRIREELDCAALDLPLDENSRDLDSLQRHLIASRGGRWAEVLGQDNIIRARNQEVVADNAVLAEGDEIAFFPPVTGG